MKSEKCEFHHETVAFLEYIINGHGVEMDTSKVNAVTKWPTPSGIKELQRFLGFTNFHYSSIAAPLLCRKTQKFHWTEASKVNAVYETLF